MTGNHNRIAVAVQRLALAFARFGWNDAALSVYVEVLADLPVGDLEHAVDVALATFERMPVPADLRRLVLSDRIDELGPEAAWALVEAELHRVGHLGRPEFPPLTREALLSVGGWYDLCRSETKAADRKVFLAAYDKLVRGRERGALMPPFLDALPLVGRHVRELEDGDGS